MSHRCQPAERLAELLGLPVADPRRAEAEACPRCGALLAALSAFHAGDPFLPAAEAEEADRVLAGLLAAQGALAAGRGGDGAATGRGAEDSGSAGIAEAAATLDAPLRGGDGAVPRGRRRPSAVRSRPLRPGAWGPRPRRLLTAAATLAAVAVVAIFAREAGDPGAVGARLRGGAEPSGSVVPVVIAVAPPSGVPGDGLRLSWTPVAGADRYTVDLFTASLDTVAALGPFPAPQAEVPASVLARAPAAGPLLAKVRAFGDGSCLGASRLFSIESQHSH